jgi:hypothetical protein
VPKSRIRKASRTRPKQGGSPVRDVFTRAVKGRARINEEVSKTALAALPPECKQERVTGALEAGELLHEARAAFEDEVQRVVDQVGSYTWLFYLRRLPEDVFAGRLATTGPYRRQMAETLSARTSVAEAFPERRKSVLPPLTRAEADVVLRLAAWTGPLSTIHAALRRAGKGQSVRWRENDMPWSVDDPALDQAIEAYDRRTEKMTGLGAGTQVVDFHPVFSRSDEPLNPFELLLAVRRTDRPQRVFTWKGPLKSPEKVSLNQGSYVIGAMSLGQSARLLAESSAQSRWHSSELPALVLALRGLFMFTWNTELGTSVSRPLSQTGYVVVPTQSVPYMLDEALKTIAAAGLDPGPIEMPLTGQAAVDILATLQPEWWPLEPGPVLRQIGEQTVIDVHASCAWLEHYLTVDRSDPIDLIHARSFHFERVVQDLIDSSPGRPSASLREMRGRTLKLNDKVLTDVDALATLGDRLILVSCKSIPHTSDLDAGVHARVRNVRTNLEKYDKVWQDLMEVLRASPHGDNYDFRGLQIVGVVCTPHPEFTNLEQLRHVELGLSAVLSMAELGEFLSSS